MEQLIFAIPPMKVRPSSVCSKSFMPFFLIIFLISGLLSGCGFCLGESSHPEEQYALEYPSPGYANHPRLDEAIKVDRFVAAQEFRNTTMVYSPTPFKRSVYNYSWWDVSPGDMVTDFLLRDLRNSGLFRAVFSYQDDAEARFHLDGSVDEFLEVDEAEGPKAVIALTVTLLDTARKEVTKSVVFQKNYRVTAPMENRTPQSLARGMSAAVEKLSRQIRTEIYDVMKNLGKPS